jgi:chromosome segregation ATPase
MRGVVLACALFAVTLAGTCDSGEVQPALQRPEIRLPSITNKWKRPGEVGGPEITIEEVERCMGEDVSMQLDIAKLKQLRSQLEAEHANVESAVTELRKRSESLETKRAVLREKLEKLNSEFESVNQRALQIGRLKERNPKTQAEVNAINSMVAEYNADVRKLNAKRSATLNEQSEFNESIVDYNASVAEVNRSTQPFISKNTEYQSLALSITSRTTAYSSRCAGERVLKK